MADESYNLIVLALGKPVLHVLRCSVELCGYNSRTRLMDITMVPLTISDQPGFPYLGLLIVTSGHYLPLPVIKKIIHSISCKADKDCTAEL